MSGGNPFVDALLDAGRAVPSGLKSWNGSDPTRRFNVHRNNMMVSLIEALAETFPVTQALVGEEFFRAMARAFVARSPPTSRLIFEYGKNLPDFIASFSPAATLPYLPDVARLEYLRVEACHAANAAPLDADVFRHLLAAPECLLSVRVRLHPACRVLRSKHAVFSIWAAHQGEAMLESVASDVPEDTLVFRPAHQVRVLALPPGGANFIGVLANNGTLAEAAAEAGLDPGFDLVANLGGLIANGLIIGLVDWAG